LLPYYNRGVAWGSFSRGLYRDAKGVWWWGIRYGGKGVFRFTEADIKLTQTKLKQLHFLPMILSLVTSTSLHLQLTKLTVLSMLGILTLLVVVSITMNFPVTLANPLWLNTKQCRLTPKTHQLKKLSAQANSLLIAKANVYSSHSAPKLVLN
jgi:hypothetical protein